MAVGHRQLSSLPSLSDASLVPVLLGREGRDGQEEWVVCDAEVPTRLVSMARIWLREERFEAALPLGTRSVRPLSGSLVLEVVRTLRTIDSRTVQYASWVTEAWKTLQWGEPTARLLWEMLMLFSYQDEGVGGQSLETWQCRVALSNLTLFLWLHLPDAFTKVYTSPSNYNIIWPSAEATASPSSTPCGSQKASSPPTHSSPPNQHSTPMHIPTAVHNHHHTSHLSLSTSPRSPRSYFQVQAWSKAEAQHVAFVKRHLRDMLASLLGLPEHSGSFSISGTDINLLGFLLSGGSDLTSEAHKLSDLAPFWQSRDTSERYPVESILPWFDHVLCVNEVLYPPPPDPSAIGRQQQEAQDPRFASPPRQHMVAPPPPTTTTATTALPNQLQRPAVFNLISHATVVRRDSDLGANRRLYLNHCHDSHIYLLGPVQLACITGCTDCTIVIGAVAGLLRVFNCERITLVAACRRLVIHNCLESTFPVFVTTNPVLAGDNRGCHLAPYNSCYPGFQNDLRTAQLPTSSPPAINYWNAPYDLSLSGLALALPVGGAMGDDSGSAGGTEAESRLLPADQFYMLSIPVQQGAEQQQPPQPPHEEAGGRPSPPPQQQQHPLQNPFALPLEYAQVLRERSSGVERLQKGMLSSLSETQQCQVETLVRVKFSEWLATSGNLRQVMDLIQLEGNSSGSSSSLSGMTGSGTTTPMAGEEQQPPEVQGEATASS